MDEKTGHQLAELEIIIAEEDGYSAEAFAAELLAGLESALIITTKR